MIVWEGAQENLEAFLQKRINNRYDLKFTGEYTVVINRSTFEISQFLSMNYCVL